jgi:glycerol uptake facilitator-like aquaporin
LAVRSYLMEESVQKQLTAEFFGTFWLVLGG